MDKVCKDVGWDGQEYYCLRCGKAGFQREAQARGHLSQCKGRAVAKGIFQPPVTAPQVLLPAGGGGVGAPTYQLGGAGGAGGGQTSSFQGDPVWNFGVDQRLKALENEYNHMLVERNLPANDWFSSNKNILIIIAVSVVALYLVTHNSQCQCGDGSKVVKNGVASLGEKALAKFVDRGIIKGVDSLFGK